MFGAAANDGGGGSIFDGLTARVNIGSLESVLADCLIIRFLVVSLSGVVGSFIPGIIGKGGGLGQRGTRFDGGLMEDCGDDEADNTDDDDEPGTFGFSGTGC